MSVFMHYRVTQCTFYAPYIGITLRFWILNKSSLYSPQNILMSRKPYCGCNRASVLSSGANSFFCTYPCDRLFSINQTLDNRSRGILVLIYKKETCKLLYLVYFFIQNLYALFIQILRVNRNFLLNDPVGDHFLLLSCTKMLQTVRNRTWCF